MPTKISYGDAGIATHEVSDTFTQDELFNSAIPMPSTEDHPVGENTEFVVGSAVGLNAGVLVLATTGGGSPVQAIGVAAAPVTTGAGGSDSIPIYRTGNFNVDALTFDASFDTLAKKKAAFQGAPAPTNIIVRERL